MNKSVLLIGAAALALSACGAAPADESPLAPEILCDQPLQKDGDSALECPVPDDNLTDVNIGNAEGVQ